MNVKNVKAALFIVPMAMLFILGNGCRSTKKISKAINKKDTTGLNQASTIDSLKLVDLHADSLKYIQMLYDHLQSNRIDFNTFSAKMRVHYEGSDGKDNELTGFVRIQKDRVIWISISATLLGIEVFRAMITPDSVKVLNKIDKIYQARSVNSLQEISHLPFDFNTIQSIIIGNPVYLDSNNILYYKKNEQGVSLLCDGEIFRNYLTLNLDDLTIKHCKLDDADQLLARSYDLTFGAYEKNGSVLFSTYRKISVAEKTKLDIEMNVNKYSFNDNLDFPFSIPKNYKRK